MWCNSDIETNFGPAKSIQVIVPLNTISSQSKWSSQICLEIEVHLILAKVPPLLGCFCGDRWARCGPLADYFWSFRGDNV